MLCPGIGSSLQRDHGHTTRQEERQRGRLPCSRVGEERLREEGRENKKGSIPSFLPFCATAAPVLLPPLLRLSPTRYDSLALSFPLLICFCGCVERMGTCRSLMIQPFSYSELHRQDSMSLLPLQCLAVLSSALQLLQLHPAHSAKVLR